MEHLEKDADENTPLPTNKVNVNRLIVPKESGEQFKIETVLIKVTFSFPTIDVVLLERCLNSENRRCSISMNDRKGAKGMENLDPDAADTFKHKG